MHKEDILSEVTKVHNTIANIWVRNDDAIYMSGALQILRRLANALQEEIKAEQAIPANPE